MMVEQKNRGIPFSKKAVVVGDGGCGKTCLLISFVQRKMPLAYLPTVYDTYIKDIKLNDGICEFVLYDTAGQDAYDRLRPLSYPDTDVMLVCISTDSPDSLYNAHDKWIPEVRHFCPTIPVVLVCNKIDLRDDQETVDKLSKLKQKPVSTEEVQQLAESVQAAAYVECSSLRNVNVDTVFRTAALVATNHKIKKKKMKKFKHMRCKFL